MKRNIALSISLAFMAVGLLTAHAEVLDLSSAIVDASGQQPSFPKYQAFDGNTGTRWASSSKPGWIWVDLGGNRYIYGVTVRWETACAQSYELYVLRKEDKSAAGFDGNEGDTVTLSSWTSVASVTGGNGGVDTFDFANQTFSSGGTASVSPTPIANYLLLNGTSTLAYGNISTYEVTVDASEIKEFGAVIIVR